MLLLKWCAAHFVAATFAQPQTAFCTTTCYTTSCFSSSRAPTQAILLSLTSLNDSKCSSSIGHSLTKRAFCPALVEAREASGPAASPLEGDKLAQYPWRSINMKSRMFCIHDTASPFKVSVDSSRHLNITDSCFNNPFYRLK